MLKRLLTAAAIMIASPGLLFSQDIFLSHVQNAPVVDTATASGSNSLFVYVRNGFDILGFDLDLNVSDSSVVSLTGASIPNSTLEAPGGIVLGTRWNPNAIAESVDAATNSANLFAEGIRAIGLNPAFAAFDEDFQSAAGARGSGGAFLLATIDYDIVGPGTADFSLSAGQRSFSDLQLNVVAPVFGDAVVSAVPEPGSAAFLALGLVGLVARRRRCA